MCEGKGCAPPGVSCDDFKQIAIGEPKPEAILIPAELPEIQVKPMTKPYPIIGGNTFAPQEKLPYLEVKEKPTYNVEELTTKEAFIPAMVGGGGAGLGPAWLRGEIEKPAEEKNYGSWTGMVYSAEQQNRLGVDENGKKVGKPMTKEKLPYLEVAEKPTLKMETLPARTGGPLLAVAPQEKLPYLEVADKPTLKMETLPATTGGPLVAVAPKLEEENILG
jgi:hypothetical protein